MGASKKRKIKAITIAVKQALVTPEPPMNVVTPGGRIQVKWDIKSNATVMGQLAFLRIS